MGTNAINNHNKYLSSGHNGPYNDPETPVRNYGHWLITLSKCYEITGEQKYLNKIEELAEYLISKSSRPFSFSFHHRNSPHWDKCNGLIGQAWTFEALYFASLILNDTKYVEVAEEVFFQHEFNTEYGLWNRLEIDGQVLSIDDTFNHQLWFASCAMLLKSFGSEDINRRVLRFLECLQENLTVMDYGLIYHPIEKTFMKHSILKSTNIKLKNSIKSFINVMQLGNRRCNQRNRQVREKMIQKSIGYHQFNMYAFAMLNEKIRNHPYWFTEEFSKSFNYLMSNEYKNNLNHNMYGYPYNPPGFAVPYVLNVFNKIRSDKVIKESSWWLNEQFKRSYNPKTQMMDRNTPDPLTQTARIYELTRLPISILDKIQLDI